MNNKTVLLPLILFLFIAHFAGSETITKVLQNGEGDYKGCKDSYTISEGPDVNYGDNSTMFHKNCQT